MLSDVPVERTNKEIPLGSTLGVLGSGQLGRMFAIEARRLGYRVHVYSPESDTPAGALADREWSADYEDFKSLDEFAASVDVVTLEFENVSVEALQHLQKRVPVRPGPNVLECAQNRLVEKTAMRRIGLPTAPFSKIESLESLSSQMTEFGGRGVLKTASWGYDGKGQQTVSLDDDLAAVWKDYDGHETILEGFVEFRRELSVIGVRNARGDFVCYDPIWNSHANHILDVSVAGPGLFSDSVIQKSKDISRTVMNELDVVGVLCVELFETSDGELLVNEIAPRPHNSGHLSINAHVCCQFAQQVRATCNLPLASTRLRQPAAMANLLGDLWIDGASPNWANVLQFPNIYLHLYGKADAKPGRKMGHLTALGDTVTDAQSKVLAARESLSKW